MKRFAKNSQVLMIALIILTSVVLVASSILLLSRASAGMQEGAEAVGLLHANEAAEQLRSAVNTYRDKSALFGSSLMSSGFTDQNDFLLKFKSLNNDPRFSVFMFMRYFKDGQEYSLNAQPFNMAAESSAVVAGAGIQEVFCAGVVEDHQYSISAVAFCVPLTGCPYADTAVLFYPTGSVFPDSESSLYAGSLLTAICSSEGEIVLLLHHEGMDVQQHNNIYEILRGQINDKSTIDNMRTLVGVGGTGSYSVEMLSQTHILSVNSIDEKGTSPFFAVCLYSAATLNSIGYNTIHTVLGELVIFFLLLMVVTASFLIYRYRNEKRLRTINDTNSVLDCPTQTKFARVAADIMARHKATAFAVVVVAIRR